MDVALIATSSLVDELMSISLYTNSSYLGGEGEGVSEWLASAYFNHSFSSTDRSIYSMWYRSIG